MAIEPITNHFNQGLVKLAPPFWGKPRIAAMLRAMLRRVQEIEDTTWEVLETYTIEGADTARLDVLGKIVGQPRFWGDDDIYRAVIRGKIRANRSRGLTDDLIDVVQLTLASTVTVGMRHLSPATLLLWINGTVDAAHQTALEFLLPKARPAGVQMHVFTTAGDVADAAVWDESTWDDGSVYWSEEIL